MRANVQDESTYKMLRAHFRFVNKRIHDNSGKKLIYTDLQVYETYHNLKCAYAEF